VQPIDDVSKRYLIAGLSVGNLVEGFVDSYHGPEELRRDAGSTPPAEAIEEFHAAIDQVEDTPRRTFFLAQERALRMATRVAEGETINYREQVIESFDITPEWVDESEFEAAHYALDKLLTGSGPLAARRQGYRAMFEIDAERVLPIAKDLLSDLRLRTQTIVPLPDGESVELKLVEGQPWSGYNWYLGGLSSRIEINTDLPVRLNDLPDLLAHEAYPGHHTEHCVKEWLHLRQQGHGEAAIALLTTPQAVVSEGIATSAFDSVVPPDEQGAWLREHVYDPSGLSIDIEGDLAIHRSSRVLSGVLGNAALLLHDQGRSQAEAVDYVMRYSLRSESEAVRSVEFLTHPFFRTYVYTYSSGYQLVNTFLENMADRQMGFRSLLTEHWTPARLRAAARRRSSDDERLPV
jgi:hypothetical protein